MRDGLAGAEARRQRVGALEVRRPVAAHGGAAAWGWATRLPTTPLGEAGGEPGGGASEHARSTDDAARVDGDQRRSGRAGQIGAGDRAGESDEREQHSRARHVHS